MERFRTSYEGIKNLVTNAFAYVVKQCEHGFHDHSDGSSCSEIDCQSDCSICDSNNRSISLCSSKRSVLSELSKREEFIEN